MICEIYIITNGFLLELTLVEILILDAGCYLKRNDIHEFKSTSKENIRKCSERKDPIVLVNIILVELVT